MPVALEYSPGDRFLAAGPTLAVFSSDRQLVERMWQVVRDGGDAAAILVGSLEDGFNSLADLVLLEGQQDHVEVLVRGDVDVVVETRGGAKHEVDGRNVRTWREYGVDGAVAVGVATMRAGVATLPLACGVVPAAGFRWAVNETAGSPIAASPERDASRIPAAAPPAVVPSAVPPAVAPAADPPPAVVPAAVPPPAVSPAAEPVEPPPPPPPPPPPDRAGRAVDGDTRLDAPDEFDHLFESTVLRSPEDAAVRIDPDEDATPPPPPPLGDHDGSTILGSQLAALLRAGRPGGDDPPVSPSPPSPPSPPTTGRILQLAFSTGQIVPVDQPIVVGRKPQVDRVSGNQIPRLVTVTGPNNDISRSHLEIKPDGANVLVTDLGSTNGTMLADAHGSRPLGAHTPTTVAPGARLDLGDGVTIDVRDAR